SDDYQFSPTNAVRQVQAEGDPQTGSRKDPDRPSERRDRHGQRARLEAVEWDARIDQAKQQEYALHGKSPPALEARQRVVRLRSRLDKQASLVSRLRKK